MDSPITRAEHEEFVRRMEDEHSRVNNRLKLLEEGNKQITDIAISVKELAVSVKSMADEQKNQGKKLEDLESRDGEMWRKVVGYVITSIIGIIIGFLFMKIGIK